MFRIKKIQQNLVDLGSFLQDRALKGPFAENRDHIVQRTSIFASPRLLLEKYLKKIKNKTRIDSKSLKLSFALGPSF